jgi:hypothetical protein
MPPSGSVLTSIFPPRSLHHSVPTPLATPDLGAFGHGPAFGGAVPSSPISERSLNPAQLQVRRNLAWSTATRFLSLAGKPLIDRTKTRAWEHANTPDEVINALSILLDNNSSTSDGQDIVSLIWTWHSRNISLTSGVDPVVYNRGRQPFPSNSCASPTRALVEGMTEPESTLISQSPNANYHNSQSHVEKRWSTSRRRLPRSRWH